MNVYGLIIAGGVGARFWPRSRERSPKQLLEILGQGTMLQNTVARLHPIIPPENVMIVTNELQVQELRKQVPGIPDENIVVEPVGRNTAPAIALGAELLKARAGDAVMVVLPADHLVHDVEAFQAVLRNAIHVAVKSRGLVTIGIKPTRPETGYGYIQFEDAVEDNRYARYGAYPVKTFAEKPNKETARSFISSGDFLWNSGMFIWKVSAILNNFAEHLPDMLEEFHRIRPLAGTAEYWQKLAAFYPQIRSISIDYGIMEKAERRFILPAEFGWNDLGSWDEVYRLSEKDAHNNIFQGNVFIRDVSNCHISTTPKRLAAAIGVEDLSIIATDDAVLVFKHGRSQEVKDIVDELRKKALRKYL
jgi:mannose-1-phosphate guanylyltransferase